MYNCSINDWYLEKKMIEKWFVSPSWYLIQLQNNSNNFHFVCFICLPSAFSRLRVFLLDTYASTAENFLSTLCNDRLENATSSRTYAYESTLLWNCRWNARFGSAMRPTGIRSLYRTLDCGGRCRVRTLHRRLLCDTLDRIPAKCRATKRFTWVRNGLRWARQ